ncbi:hypothetical protein BpHYR1_040065 [Brachionus plicatilis]|uniref:Uncharacterized protein n=1 Tax=Brachionus plicatilis TaxID=10195 RepID=A0A3M7QLX0_BRAPC|nr:hypothetical protein BpHYR1_040065 [Brachionus plicatilis]
MSLLLAALFDSQSILVSQINATFSSKVKLIGASLKLGNTVRTIKYFIFTLGRISYLADNVLSRDR